MGGKLGVAIRCKRGRRGMSFGRGVVSDGWRGDDGAYQCLFSCVSFFGLSGLATSHPRFIFDSVPPHGPSCTLAWPARVRLSQHHVEQRRGGV
jgi:hypothetical protein